MFQPNSKFTKPRLLALVFVFFSVLLILFFAAAGRIQTKWANTLAVTITAPLESAFSYVGYKYNDFVSYVSEVFYVYDQNRELKAENERLKLKLLTSSELETENARLAAMLDYKTHHPEFDVVAARIIGRSPSTWTSRVIINKGENAGLKKYMAVITPNGLVGTVYQVYANYAEVELLSDPRSAVGAIVARQASRVAGIVKGSTDEEAAITMNNVPQDADIQDGDLIITSGFGGIYPKGIPIGTVTKLKKSTDGLLQYALIYPATDFQKLEDVLVIVNSREPIPNYIANPAKSSSGGKS